MIGETPATQKSLAERLALLSPAQRQLVERKLAAGRGSDVVPPRTVRGPAPLSFSQEHLWRIQQTTPGMVAYNVPQAMRLSGPLDADALRFALDALVARHPLLRTNAGIFGGKPATVAGPPRPLELVCIDLRTVANDERGRILPAELRRLANVPFDLERDVPFRAALVQLASDDHALSLVWHHVASDETSADILFRDLGELYDACVSGRVPSLPALQREYADFADWQRTYWSGERLGELVDAWSAELDARPARLELPLDRARPAIPDYAGARRSFCFEGPWVPRLLEIGAALGATPFVTLLAAYATLLHRYSQQQRIYLGSVFTTRGRSEFEDVFGYFSGVLPFGVSFAGNPSFTELVARVRETYLFVMDHRDVPFDALSAELLARDSSRELPVLDAFFTMTKDREPRFGGLAASALAIDLGTSKLDLFTGAAVAGTALRFDVEFRTGLFDAETIARLFENFETLLRSIAIDPGSPVSEYALLGAAERALASERDDTRVAYRRDATVVDLFCEQAARTPHAIAVASGTSELSYAQLDERVGRLATYLRARGAGPDVVVAMCLERSADLAVALLAVQRAGSAYLPIDELYPRERIAFVLEDAQPVLTIVHESLRSLLPPEAAVVSLERDAIAIAACEPIGSDARPAPQHLAHVIYTSGSTGQPKGTLIEHRNAMGFVAALREAAPIEAGTTVVSVVSVAFDIACHDFYAGFSSGARVEIVPRETITDGAALGALLERSKSPTMHATPSLWRMLVESGWQGHAGLSITCGGEALPQTLAEQLMRRGRAVANGYGPTEATVYCSIAHLRPGDLVSLGRALANVRLSVCDALGRPLPSGAIGELIVAGDGVGRGYANRPELTAERFVADPSAVGRKMYRTGDRARYTNAGTLEFLGRGDDQIKIRGYRIELGEIEHALDADPAVLSAAVVVRATGGEPILVAYYVAREPAGTVSVVEATLRARLRETLPPYMVPHAIARIDAWPLNASGKIDRVALARREVDARIGRVAFVAPRSDTERRLATIWEGVLHLEGLGMRENFVDLGGQSILAMRVASRVQEAFGIRLPMAALFAYPTIASMAAYVDERSVPAFESINPLHHQLATLWERELGLDRIGIDADFFDSGGSLRDAERLLRSIEIELGAAIALAAFLERPTIAHVARTIARERQSGAASSPVTALRAEGRLAPFFFMHLDMHGGGYYTLALARRLDPERPFYILPPHRAGGPDSIESMADDYLAAIKAVRPSGPYVLGGFCSGGLMALEIARRLEAEGERVSHLVLLDPSARNAALRPVADALDRSGKALGIGSNVGTEVCGTVGIAMRRASEASVKTQRVLRLAMRSGARGLWQRMVHGPVDSTYVPPDDETILPFWERVAARYVPRPYAGRMTVFVPRGRGAVNASATARRWHVLAPRATFHAIPGEHLTCITRFVDDTATELAAALDRAEKSGN